MSVAEEVFTPAKTPFRGVAPANGPQWQQRYVRALIVTDVIVVALALVCAQTVKLGRPITAGDPASVYFLMLSCFVGAIWLTLLSAYRTRSPRIVGAGVEEYRRVVSATLATIGFVAVALMIFRPEYARGYLAVAFPLGLAGLVVGRNLCRLYLARQRRRGRCVVNVLAVGDARAVRSLVQSLTRGWGYGYLVVGVCLTGRSSGGTIDVPEVGTLPVLGDEGKVHDAILKTNADTVALTTTDHLGPEGVRELSWDLHKLGVDLVVTPGVVDVAGPRLTMRPVAGLPLIHVEKPQYSGTKKIQKLAFDYFVSISVLIGALPVMLASAIAIKLTSRGPVFYRSERIGLDGQPFQMIKFRTMVEGADKQVDSLKDVNDSVGGVLFKVKNDPRVTAVGRLLRKYSIDELPQFFNVLRRDMSVVGPRPPLRREVDTYNDQVRRRLLVLPGITGLWQVSGRSDLSWEDSVRLDLSYVENWSITNDLLIAVKTVRTVATGSGAY
ncbi:polyprenyl glycosylphosphotransferase [Mycolicibacterium arabiense]|uniref:Polyprenyl glycosylphosphotransferase n=1 Tax=Mycolicibacterium arabiense TaxID=1286181 RepID=A0A7I7RY88_9MYCO|nr:sugar transferase [Mycolicibacterium arabiense]MCV7373731.1 sugar transferase [Mycolicibacterium arabiense]BBY48976.1 polyprenyl glycosylphosphotransferase [Mycolicibacterium arabiense]